MDKTQTFWALDEGQIPRHLHTHDTESVNPLSPDIDMHLLLIARHIFLMVPVGGIYLKIKTFCLW